MSNGGGDERLGSSPPSFAAVPPPLVEWDFRAGFRAVDDSGHGLRLRPLSAVGPRWRVDSEVGGVMHFDGVTDALTIPAAETGALDVSRRGDQVTVVALVRRSSLATGFIAGMWQEDDSDPRRQYGLFVSLPTYGGAQQVCGHVSATGGANPGIPFSRDYAASERQVALGRWSVVAFSYDGAEIVAYLDGEADARPHYREPGPPLGAGLSYAKNPYRFPDGLNRRVTSDFTIGAVRLSAGMGNNFAGDLARVAVWATALDAAQHLALARAWHDRGNTSARSVD